MEGRPLGKKVSNVRGCANDGKGLRNTDPPGQRPPWIILVPNVLDVLAVYGGSIGAAAAKASCRKPESPGHTPGSGFTRGTSLRGQHRQQRVLESKSQKNRCVPCPVSSQGRDREWQSAGVGPGARETSRGSVPRPAPCSGRMTPAAWVISNNLGAVLQQLKETDEVNFYRLPLTQHIPNIIR